jgi:hypothetical protein
MIDYSLCPDLPIKTGQDKRGRGYVTTWLNSLDNLSDGNDASAGALKSAVKGSVKLFVTSYQYTLGTGAFTCFNVMVNRQDYRIYVGYDEKAIRVETLDARSARAETRKQAQRWVPTAEPVPSASLSDDNPASNYQKTPGHIPGQIVDEPLYANNPFPDTAPVSGSASGPGSAVPPQ